MIIALRFIILALLITTTVTAQIFPAKNYPKGYFTWPVQAKQALAANFGELRPNHYHMGLDCKTDQRENVPILAAADGYIAKVKIEPYGFGRCIYINHPNGLTTLYAHLNGFYPALEKYVTDQQYKLESWKIFIDVPANLLPVTKGQFIANSGNTGGSQGPHLHFEIRDTKTDKVLNPLLFGFPIVDKVAPSILRLAVYDRSKSTWEQTPKFIPIKKVNGVYQTVPANIAIPTDKVSFAITAFDVYSGSTNQNGIYEANLYDDEQPIVGFQLDSINYDETRYLNGHIDFKLRANGGPFVQHLSRLPGFPQGTYKDVNGDGVIDLSDGATHPITIEVKDTEGNTSLLKFGVRSLGKPAATAVPKNMFRPGYLNVFENQNLCFYLGENQLYDSLDFNITPIAGMHPGAIAYQLHGGYIPAHTYYNVRIRNATVNPEHLVMHRWWGGKNDYAEVTKEGDWYRSSFKAFGNVELYEDLVPPSITPVGFSNGMNAAKLNRIVFVIRDETDELRNFRAELDGKWLRFSNDKGKTFIYQMDERCGPGAHELTVSVEDCAGNRTERVYRFTR